MNFNITVNPKNNPNETGEFLRNEFFKEEYETYHGRNYRKLGCYSIFELAESVVELPDELLDEEHPEDGKYNVFSKVINGREIIMKYYWDGDGQLEFHFPDGSMLINDDCKKDYVWEYYDEQPIDY